jgi:hypothetical protein
MGGRVCLSIFLDINCIVMMSQELECCHEDNETYPSGCDMMRGHYFVNETKTIKDFVGIFG